MWVWQFWLLYNHYMCQLDFHQLTIGQEIFNKYIYYLFVYYQGPKMFLNCPVQSNNADSIYK